MTRAGRMLIVATVAIFCTLIMAALFDATVKDPVLRYQYVATQPAGGYAIDAPSVTAAPAPVSSSVDVSEPQPTLTVDKVRQPTTNDIPVSVSVQRGSEVIVPAAIISPAMSLTSPTVWSPEPGVAEWHQKNVHPKPGVVSPYHAIIGGHVDYNGPDVFANLSSAEVGDTVVVTYRSGDEYRFVVNTIFTGDKESMSVDPRIKGSHPDAQSVVLLTCDDGSGYLADGHRVDNLAVIATVIDE